jgi:hypothetical protein
VSTPDRADAALEPVRAALRARAAEQAAQIVADARAEAADVTARASLAAAEVVEHARADGAAEAGPVAAAEVARSRRRARAVALRAEEATRQDLASQITMAVLALRDAPDYPVLLAGLSALATRSAGAGAVVAQDPAGGVAARAPGLVVDLSLPRLAERAVSQLAGQIADLCR